MGSVKMRTCWRGGPCPLAERCVRTGRVRAQRPQSATRQTVGSGRKYPPLQGSEDSGPVDTSNSDCQPENDFPLFKPPV